MVANSMDWVEDIEKKKQEEFEEGYFNITEGDNRIQLLTYCAPLAQVWNQGTKKYEVATEGAKNVSIKGVCWVLHEGKVKQAKLPYTVVKAIRALQTSEETAFSEFPMPYGINIKAKNAGSKEVEYTVIASRADSVVSEAIRAELAQKQTPEDIVEKAKEKVSPIKSANIDYPKDDINPDDVPF